MRCVHISVFFWGKIFFFLCMLWFIFNFFFIQTKICFFLFNFFQYFTYFTLGFKTKSEKNFNYLFIRFILAVKKLFFFTNFRFIVYRIWSLWIRSWQICVWLNFFQLSFIFIIFRNNGYELIERTRVSVNEWVYLMLSVQFFFLIQFFFVFFRNRQVFFS